MADESVRLMVGLLMAALLAWQGTRTKRQPNRRRGFFAAAAALLCVVAYTALMREFPTSTGGIALLGGALALFVLALYSFFRAYNSGELSAAGKQFQEEMRRYGDERRTKTKK